MRSSEARRRARSRAAGARRERIAPVVGVAATMLVFGAAMRPSAASADAADLAPTREQVAERDRGIGALWNTFRTRAAGLRTHLDQGLVSSGEFDGARTWWLRSGVALEAGVPIGERVEIGLSPSFAWERLLVEGSETFVFAQSGRERRFTDFLDSSLRVGARVMLDERWDLELATGFSSRHEDGARYAESARAGGSLAFSYRRGRWLRLRLGVGLGSDIDDGKLRVSPVYRIVLRPLPNWSLEASGLGGAIEWDARPSSRLALTGGVDGTQYRLERRGQPPVSGGQGTLQRRQSTVGLELRETLNDHLRLRLGLGLVLREELTVIDEDGVDVDSRRNRDPSVTLRFGIELQL